MNSLRLLLSTFKLIISEDASSCLDFHKIRNKILTRFPPNYVSFDGWFYDFCSLVQSDYSRSRTSVPNLQILLFEDKYKEARIRFLVVGHLLLFFQSRVFRTVIDPILHLLHYRGLGLNGLFILQQIGLGPDPRTITSSLKRFIQNNIKPEADSCIWWFDNLRRQLKGRLKHNLREDWTVVARTFAEQTPLRHGWASCGDIFGSFRLLHEAIIDADQIDLQGPDSMLGRVTELSNPLRARHPQKFKLCEDCILPIKCGTVEGTVEMLSKFCSIVSANPERFICLVIDYDLYWRTHRLYFSQSIIGAFQTLREGLVVIQGPWHVFKTFAESIWSKFSRLILAELWLFVIRRPCPTAPDVKDIIFIFIAVYSIVKISPTWIYDPDNVLQACCYYLFYHLIPLCLSLAMALQSNDVDSYFSLLAAIIPWFNILGNSNYTNSCELFLLQWLHWKKITHPIVSYLRKNFKACNEEYGESAIHLLMTHVRDWNYTGENLNTHWEESGVARFLFENLGLQSLRNPSSTKWYSVIDPCTEFRKMSICFNTICGDIQDGNHFPFLKSDTGYNGNSQRSENISDYTTMLSRMDNRFILATNHVKGLKPKLMKKFEKEAMKSIDHDKFFQ